MSFSSDIKTELSKLNNLKNKSEVYAEFLGYLVSANISFEKNNCKFATENEYNINRFTKLLDNAEIDNYKIDIQGKNYIVTFKNIINISIDLLEKNLKMDECKKAFVRGAFLGGGSVNNPQNKYHLEIMLYSNEFSNFMLKILESYNIKSKILNDDKHIIIYIKEGEEISKFLALIGASSGVLKFEETRVIRDMKNNVNRIVNCETANLNRTIGTSVEQIENIKKLKKNGKFTSLSDDLKEISKLREENPDATLEELGNMLEKPISKSSVNYRFKKIKLEAEK